QFVPRATQVASFGKGTPTTRNCQLNCQIKYVEMILAGDIGGTKTLLGLFDLSGDRPTAIHSAAYATLAHADLTDIIAEFLKEQRVAGASISDACFGVAGPVIDEAAELTNVPWRVDARKVAHVFRLRRVSLLNDLEAMGYSVPVLRNDEVL